MSTRISCFFCGFSFFFFLFFFLGGGGGGSIKPVQVCVWDNVAITVAARCWFGSVVVLVVNAMRSSVCFFGCLCNTCGYVLILDLTLNIGNSGYDLYWLVVQKQCYCPRNKSSITGLQTL